MQRATGHRTTEAKNAGPVSGERQSGCLSRIGIDTQIVAINGDAVDDVCRFDLQGDTITAIDAQDCRCIFKAARLDMDGTFNRLAAGSIRQWSCQGKYRRQGKAEQQTGTPSTINANFQDCT